MSKLLSIILMVSSININAQQSIKDSITSESPTQSKTFFKHIDRKGKLFLTWGWNRSQYSNSNIHFTGSGYSFTLHDVKASDKPTPFSADVYFNPSEITNPQYQYRVGYYFNDHWNFSLGFNHMKYVMDQNQTVKIDGEINTIETTTYNKFYSGDNIVLADDFLMFEHTNGLNYISVQTERIDAFWVSKNKKFNANIIEGAGAGIIYPKSDVTLFGDRYDKWHLSGYGLSAHVAVRFDFLKHFFIQTQLEGGFINMPDVLTTNHEGAKAKQNFFYLEEMISFGGYINLFSNK
jgi:hypothetical protein